MVFGKEGDVLMIIMMMVLMGNKCVESNGSMFSAFIDLKKE